MTKVISEFSPYLRTLLVKIGEEWSGDRVRWQMLVAPGADHDHGRQQFDSRLGEAVDNFLFVSGIFRRAEQTCLDEVSQPRGKSVGGNLLLRTLQQHAEVAPIGEHYVAQHNKAPPITEQLGGQVNRAV